ncbi:MAG: hypothetical protein AAFN12_10945 [Cyanobacteria bacterium J06560_2]
MAEFDFEKIIQQIRDLEKERAEILTQSLSPEGAWIHHYADLLLQGVLAGANLLALKQASKATGCILCERAA